MGDTLPLSDMDIYDDEYNIIDLLIEKETQVQHFWVSKYSIIQNFKCLSC